MVLLVPAAFLDLAFLAAFVAATLSMAPRRKAEFKEDEAAKTQKFLKRTKTLSDEVQQCIRDCYTSFSDYQVDGKLNMAGNTLREVITQDLWDM